MVLALHGHRGKPSHITAIVINHVISLNPQKLVALVGAELRHGGLVPPVALLHTAGAATGVFSSRHRGGAGAGVDLETRVGGYEGCVGPICFDASALRGPIVCVPD